MLCQVYADIFTSSIPAESQQLCQRHQILAYQLQEKSWYKLFSQRLHSHPLKDIKRHSYIIKTHRTMRYKFYNNACLSSGSTGQPAHLHSRIRAFTGYMIHLCIELTLKALIVPHCNRTCYHMTSLLFSSVT